LWEEVTQIGATRILPLGPDTLLAGYEAGGGSTLRSVDGGEDWTGVADFGGALFAASTGAVLTGTADGAGVGYSTDRGATWAMATFMGSDPGDGEAFAEVPEGHPQGGRLVAACFDNGLMYSDDGGRTWAPSSVWEDFFYLGHSVAVGADGRVWATMTGNGAAGTALYESADGGATYEVAHTFTQPGGTGSYVVALPGGDDPEVGVLVVAEYDGDVWRSDDGAQSWRLAGRVPFEDSGHPNDVVVSPDGRLYVAGSQAGGGEWVWRTTEPVVTAQEPGAAPEGIGVRLEVSPNPFRGEAVVTLTLREPSRVRVAVYDVLGREVAVLADGVYGSGRHEALLDGAALPSGTYLVRLVAGEVVDVERLTLRR
jgi:hypothetical protein